MRTLTTARLTLEPLTRSHAPEMFAALSDPAIYRFMEEKSPVSVEALAQRYARLESRCSGDGREHWLNWVVRETATGNAAGFVQASVAEHVASIAYVLAPSMQRRGFGREATAAMIEELREHYGAARLRSNIDKRNTASVVLIVSLGFVEVPCAEEGDRLFEKRFPSRQLGSL